MINRQDKEEICNQQVKKLHKRYIQIQNKCQKKGHVTNFCRNNTITTVQVSKISYLDRNTKEKVENFNEN